MTTIHPNEVAARFGRAVKSYHQKAEIQKKVAEGLHAALQPWQDILPPGPILEIGCGTGLYTKLLLSLFPHKEFIITDASSEMLSFCKAQMQDADLLRDNITFELFDPDADETEQEKYSMITGNFVAQWFRDTAIGLERLTKTLKPGGLLLASFPGEQSFPQWYENCLELGLPYTAHPLPNVERVGVALSLGPQQIDYYENDLYQEFDSAMDFFLHLKETGSTYSKLKKHITPKQFRLLIRHWDSKATGKVRVKWHIAYLAAKKDIL